MITSLALPVLLAVNPLQPAEALLGDLGKLVFLREQQGWKIDRYDVDSLLPDALLSMCRVPEEQRQQAAWELDRRLVASGGPLQSAYQKSGQMAGLESLLHLSRVQLLFDAARQRAESECPIYIEANHRFAGEQIHPGRWSLGGEGGGVFGVVNSSEGWSFGGGGNARLTINHVFRPRWSARLGLAVGGAALMSPTLSTEDMSVDLNLGIPIALRRHGTIWHTEVEVEPELVGIPFVTELRPAIQLGIAAGFSYVRVRQALPTVGFRMTVTRVAAGQDRPAALALRAGVRVGFDWRLRR